MHPMNMAGMGTEMMECARNCQECYATCTATIAHCLEKGGKHADSSHIGIMMDCAKACEMSADFMLRSSTLHAKVCGVCAEACERCAADCERMPEDEMMRRCAELCRRCAESCRRMAA